MSKKKVFLLGGYDLEMLEIKKILDSKNVEYKDKNLVMEILYTNDIANKDFKKAYATAVRVHAEYRINQNSHFDMAVVKLNKEIPEDYEPISILPAAVELKNGDLLLSMGYGIKYDNEQYSKKRLNKVDSVRVVEDQGTKILLDQTNGRGICSGDSGGPTLYKYQGKYYLLGINSGVQSLYKDVKATCKMHGVLIKAQTFKPWILKMIQEI